MCVHVGYEKWTVPNYKYIYIELNIEDIIDVPGFTKSCSGKAFRI